MNKRFQISLCNSWEFVPEWSEAFLRGEGSAEAVRIPHTVREQPLHYALPSQYECVCGYRRKIRIPEDAAGNCVSLRFDGAAHIATVYLNGKELCTHHGGYTAFRVEIGSLLKPGEEGLLAVRLDCTENPSIPPFGFVIDYLTYGGLYREVWMEGCPRDHIEDLYLTTPASNQLNAEVTVSGDCTDIRLQVLDGETCLWTETGREKFSFRVPNVKNWSPENPQLYTCRAELLSPEGDVLDVYEQRFGFRTAEFRADGFYLNGRKTFLRGLNRHQSFPYIGYAAPASLQREDARILKKELGCNAVRTSHYPQSQHFLDACDELGLLVFTELPGWQHIGGADWKDRAIAMVKEMILQYRRHCSIVLWGVRINESQDDDEFYARTNALAHRLDPSRPTSGVRYLKKSHLLEDVYAFNDFSHTGDNPGVLPKKDVTPDMGKALLVSECNGHMFPTKPFDTFEKRQEHALRHARVQNAAAADGEHAGCFGWCMFDYATHKDFGSGDRICYHGVLDSFRNPKLAAAVYASQGEAPVLEIGSSLDIGDYPGGNIGKIYAFTNADEVRLYRNDHFVASFRSEGWNGLKHGPVLIDDMIGALLETEEGYPPEEAKQLRVMLNALKVTGPSNITPAMMLRMGYCALRYRLTTAEVTRLYGKYVGNWGGEATRWRFDAVRDGIVIASSTRGPVEQLRLETRCSASVLTEGDTYDMAAVRIRIVDEYGNLTPYAQLPLTLEAEGAVALVGPSCVTAEGGSSGCYLRSTGRPGTGSLTVSAPGLEPVRLCFEVREA
ncbi:MAG: glycoside hydrolase family 2 protein [Oscillospiraceae bacterium]|nr:glycoside hydrolase family 2 protein [Oscillospiraceae bacterium]